MTESSAARLMGQVWRKSSFSEANGNADCIEIAHLAHFVGVRDSKNTDGPALRFAAPAWSMLLVRLGHSG